MTVAPTSEPVAETPRTVGLITRAIAFALDAALISVAAVTVEIGVALVVLLLHLPDKLKAVVLVIGGVAYILWTMTYFVIFWTTTGQTPGARAMRIQVTTTTGATLGPRRAIIRCVGLVLAALPLFAGYLLILVDSRRRGLQDRIARSLVVEAGGAQSIAESLVSGPRSGRASSASDVPVASGTARTRRL